MTWWWGCGTLWSQVVLPQSSVVTRQASLISSSMWAREWWADSYHLSSVNSPEPEHWHITHALSGVLLQQGCCHQALGPGQGNHYPDDWSSLPLLHCPRQGDRVWQTWDVCRGIRIELMPMTTFWLNSLSFQFKKSNLESSKITLDYNDINASSCLGWLLWLHHRHLLWTSNRTQDSGRGRDSRGGSPHCPRQSKQGPVSF